MKIKRTMLLLLAGILSVVMSGCKNPTTSDEEESVIVQSEYDNCINLAIDSIDTLNPIFTKSVSVYDCMGFIFEPLFVFDEAYNPIAKLAKSCTPSSDGTRYTVKINEDVLWHDGTTLTSVDVLHTINLIRYNESRYSSLLKYVSSVTTTDNSTIVIGLSHPVANFCALLSFPIVQSSVTAENLSDFIPIGTGPFKYDGKSTSDKIKLVANENYYGEKPAVSQVYLNILKDGNAVANAFNASEIDAVTSTLADFGTNTPRGDIYTNEYISNNMVFLGINCSSGVLMKPNTRKAIAYLTDKQDIVVNEIFSRGEAVNLPLNPEAWYAPKINDTAYDSEYVKDILSLDGWKPDGDGGYTRQRERYTDDSDEPVLIDELLRADIIVNEDNSERIKIAERIAGALNNFGIKCNVRKMSFEDYTQRINDKEYSLFLGEIKLPYNMDNYSLLCENDNYFAYSSNAMNDAVYKMGMAQAQNDETEAYLEFANLFLEEMPFVPLFFRKESVIYEKSISGTSKPTVFSSYTNPENWYVSHSKSQNTVEEESMEEE